MDQPVILTRKEWDELTHFIRCTIAGEYHLMEMWMKLQNKVTTRLDKESTNG